MFRTEYKNKFSDVYLIFYYFNIKKYFLRMNENILTKMFAYIISFSRGYAAVGWSVCPQAEGWVFESQLRQSLKQVVTAPLPNAWH